MQRIWSTLLLAALAGACGGSTDQDGDGSGGSAGTSGASGSGGSSGNGGASGSGGGVPCEGIVPCCDSQGNSVDPICPGGAPAQCPPGTTVPPTGICEGPGSCSPNQPCSADEFCDYPDDLCGSGASGSCKPRPRGCDLLYAPACGCDGEIHPNACAAQTSGSDVSASGACAAPAGLFACGSQFCEVGSQLCKHEVSDVGGVPDHYECGALPASCGSTPSCVCVESEPCGSWCTTAAPGEITLTCPGG